MTARAQTGLADFVEGLLPLKSVSSSMTRSRGCLLTFQSSPAPVTGRACRIPNAHQSALGGLSWAHRLYIEEVWAGLAVAVTTGAPTGGCAGAVASQALGASRGIQEPWFEQQMLSQGGLGTVEGTCPPPFPLSLWTFRRLASCCSLGWLPAGRGSRAPVQPQLCLGVGESISMGLCSAPQPPRVPLLRAVRRPPGPAPLPGGALGAGRLLALPTVDGTVFALRPRHVCPVLLPVETSL